MTDRVAWTLAGLWLVLVPGGLGDAGSLDVHREDGRVTVAAHGVLFGKIVRALTQRGGAYVLVDAPGSAQPVSVRCGVGGIPEALLRFLREAWAAACAMAPPHAQG